MDRNPIVAGQFYPGAPKGLQEQVAKFMEQAPSPQGPTLLAMAPHAGYVFSGPVAGKTLGEAELARDILLLGPNHTGRGTPFSVWNNGAWNIPGGAVPVNQELAQTLLDAAPELQADTDAHLQEHSLEVMLPFLVARQENLRIVPVAVAEQGLQKLLAVGKSMAGVLANWPEPVSIVVSTDMSHYVPHDQAQERDRLALERIEAMDPQGLYNVVRRNNITMCGVLPMTLGLAICKELGAQNARITAYDTSATASGDYTRVVGYAGALVQA